MFTITGKYTTAVVMIGREHVESSCVAQIQNMTNHPAFTGPIRIMPDTHAGKGSVIGFTMPLGDKVIPNVVGVDVSCMMTSFNIGQTMKIPREELDAIIRAAIPFGMRVHERAVLDMEKDFPWTHANAKAQEFATKYGQRFGRTITAQTFNYDWFVKKCRQIKADLAWVVNSIGTLGGGNHFIEVGRSEKNGDLWVTIHTGSRNYGAHVCSYWQNEAASVNKRTQFENRIREIKETTTDGREIGRLIEEAKRELGIDVKQSKELAHLEGDAALGYLFDMIFAQVYAETNHDHIARIIAEALDVTIEEKIRTVHNFIDFDDFVIRKGAIRAYAGERMIIPFNMEDGLLICEGKSNPEWNCSAPHGAGRLVPREEAKLTLSLETYAAGMKEKNVFSSSICRATLDECRAAYKDPALIEAAIAPTAKVIDRVRPILNLKDDSDDKKTPAWKRRK